jgi:hypothetical protein
MKLAPARADTGVTVIPVVEWQRRGVLCSIRF